MLSSIARWMQEHDYIFEFIFIHHHPMSNELKSTEEEKTAINRELEKAF